MRKILIIGPLLLVATPALAQSAPPPASVRVPDVLTDPATAEKIANAAQALSDALLDLPVGQVQAAIEGRRATAAEKRMTVRDMARKDDPNFDRDVQRQIAQTGPMIRQGMNALADAIPVVMQSLDQAQKAIERAAANMPDPTYPRR
jgi:hypothetical protein